jgi:hypothetical protein
LATLEGRQDARAGSSFGAVESPCTVSSANLDALLGGFGLAFEFGEVAVDHAPVRGLWR